MKFLAGLVVAIALAVAVDANACSCAPSTLEDDVQSTDAIFVGKVVRLEVTRVVDGVSTIAVVIDVKRTFKGKVPKTVVMRTSDGCCYCAPWFDIAKTYLFFAEVAGSNFSTSTCMRTKLLSEAKEELKLLEGRQR